MRNYQVCLISPFNQGNGIKLIPTPESPQLATVAVLSSGYTAEPCRNTVPLAPLKTTQSQFLGESQAYEIDVQQDLRITDLGTRKSYHSLDLKY